MNAKQKKVQRQTRIRKQIKAVTILPRLSVFRSNQHISAQIIDDKENKTLLTVIEKTDTKGTKTERAKVLGEEVAKAAVAKKITEVVFDKGPYAYHGRVKALADGAREGGLKF